MSAWKNTLNEMVLEGVSLTPREHMRRERKITRTFGTVGNLDINDAA